MFSIDKSFLEVLSKETGFIRDNLEKVYRLIEVLEFINSNAFLRERLVLKGGTAINLTVFDLPRLSVDIDLDFTQNCPVNEMLETKTEINEILSKYMFASGYLMDTRRVRDTHSLNSSVYTYKNAGGNLDNIKIEINYAMRAHILPLITKDVKLEFMRDTLKVRTLASQELFGSKIKALLERTASRDLYDINNMIEKAVFGEADRELLRKCVLFYKTVGSSGRPKQDLALDEIDKLTYSDFKQTLLPVLRKKESLNIDALKSNVKEYLSQLLVLTDREREYLTLFLRGEYSPELLFEDQEIVARIEQHPMATWKVQNYTITPR